MIAWLTSARCLDHHMDGARRLHTLGRRAQVAARAHRKPRPAGQKQWTRNTRSSSSGTRAVTCNLLERGWRKTHLRGNAAGGRILSPPYFSSNQICEPIMLPLIVSRINHSLPGRLLRQIPCAQLALYCMGEDSLSWRRVMPRSATSCVRSLRIRRVDALMDETCLGL